MPNIDSDLLVLLDQWPGQPAALPVPYDGFTGSVHHNVASPAYPLGTKLQVYNTGVKAGIAGVSTLIYLRLGTQQGTMAAKAVVAQSSATAPWTVSNASSAAIALATGPKAISLSAMTDTYYGWFWCGGVCPEEFIAALLGDYATDGNVVAGGVSAVAANNVLVLAPCGAKVAATQTALTNSTGGTSGAALAAVTEKTTGTGADITTGDGAIINTNFASIQNRLAAIAVDIAALKASIGPFAVALDADT